MERVAREIDVTQLIVGDLLVGGIVGSVECGLDAQAGTCGGVLKQVDYDLMADEGTAAPVWVMCENRRCSILFHLLVPGGK